MPISHQHRSFNCCTDQLSSVSLENEIHKTSKSFVNMLQERERTITYFSVTSAAIISVGRPSNGLVNGLYLYGPFLVFPLVLLQHNLVFTHSHTHSQTNSKVASLQRANLLIRNSYTHSSANWTAIGSTTLPTKL